MYRRQSWRFRIENFWNIDFSCLQFLCFLIFTSEKIDDRIQFSILNIEQYIFLNLNLDSCRFLPLLKVQFGSFRVLCPRLSSDHKNHKYSCNYIFFSKSKKSIFKLSFNFTHNWHYTVKHLFWQLLKIGNGC